MKRSQFLSPRFQKNRAIPAVWTFLRLVLGGHSRDPGIWATRPKAMADREADDPLLKIFRDGVDGVVTRQIETLEMRSPPPRVGGYSFFYTLWQLELRP